MNKRGFTLIELLVVIAVMAMLVTIALPNYVSARARARDAQKKAALDQMKKALRFYYNDYQKYPESSDFKSIYGCGAAGDEKCPLAGCVYDFAAGGNGCSTATLYMKKFPDLDPASASSLGWNYRSISNGEAFYIFVQLENASDTEIAASQARCPQSTYSNCQSNYYCVCDD